MLMTINLAWKLPRNYFIFTIGIVIDNSKSYKLILKRVVKRLIVL
jgi:hypothetical protein